MKILQAQSFKKSVKRLHINQKKCLDEAIKVLCKDPLSGELKKADLSGVRVYKFKMISLLALLAYKYDNEEDRLMLLKVGSHENFYRDLK